MLPKKTLLLETLVQDTGQGYKETQPYRILMSKKGLAFLLLMLRN